MRTHSRRQFLLATLGFGGTAGLAGAGILSLTDGTRQNPPPDGPRQADLNLQAATEESSAFGTSVRITCCHADLDVARRGARAAIAALRDVDRLMSLYRPDSQLVALNRDRVLHNPHAYLVDILRRCRAMSERTGGAFDVTVQPLWALYRRAQQEGTLPAPATIEKASSRVDWRQIDIATNRIRLGGEGSAITLNGAAQGYAADLAAAALAAHGVQHALIDTGELRSVGRKSDGTPWTVGVQHPRRPDAYISLVELGGRCLATSGDYATRFSSDYAHNHLFDPRTGRCPVAFASVSVVAPTATEADMLSTALSVLPPQEGFRLLESYPATDAFFVLKDGRAVSTEGFPTARSQDVS